MSINLVVDLADIDVAQIVAAVRARHLAAGVEPLPPQPLIDVVSRCLAESAVKTEARYQRLKHSPTEPQPT